MLDKLENNTNMPVMKTDFDVAIVGAGIIGGVLALSLSGHGLRVAILDTRRRLDATPPFDGFAYALSASSCRCLETLGLGATLRKHGQVMHRILVADGLPGHGCAAPMLEFDAQELDAEPMSIMLEARHVSHAIDDALGDRLDVERIESSITGLDRDSMGVTLGLPDGSGVRASLVVGCDGAASMVAKLAGLARHAKTYRQTAIACAISHERPHNGTACQLFLPTGPLAILPLRGRRSCIIWTETTDRGQRLADASAADFRAELQSRLGTYLGRFRLIGKRSGRPLWQSRTGNMTARRIALAGDAAHVIHPLAGQGLNLGLRDAAALSETLIHARRRGEDIGVLNILERYEVWRAPDAALFTLATDGLNSLYSTNDPLRRLLRRTGMAVVARSPALKLVAMRCAAGLESALPQLMTGHQP